MTTPTDLLTGKLLDLINQLQVTVSAHGQDALNLALASIQVDAAGYLLTSLGAFVFAFLVYKLKRVVFVEDVWEDDLPSTRAILYIIFLCLPAAGFLLYGLSQLFDIWNYAALINPKLYLAHTVVEHILTPPK